MNATIRLLVVMLATGMWGCEGTLDCDVCGEDHATQAHATQVAGDTATPKEMNHDVLLEFVTSRRTDSFVRVNPAPYPSDVSDSSINVFVSEFALPEYLETAPADAHSNGMIPRGAFVVREIVDGSGDVAKLTAVYRGPAGYNPESGDFWFAVTDAEGNPATDESGKRMVGPLAACSSCHAGRAEADYLFGVPNDFRDPAFALPTVGQNPGADELPEDDAETEEDQTPPVPETPKTDLTGWTLVNSEPDLSRPQRGELPSLSVSRGSLVVLARDATREEFQGYWGVDFGDDVVFVDMGGVGSFGAPIVNGGESWELIDSNGERVDGPTPRGVPESSYRWNGAGWTRGTTSDATPGRADVPIDSSTRLSEWSDADNFRMEFVEIVVGAP